MTGNPRQIDLFAATGPAAQPAPLPGEIGGGAALLPRQLPLERRQLLAWQQRLADHQGPLFQAAAGQGGAAAPRIPGSGPALQGSLFAAAGSLPAAATRASGEPQQRAAQFDPLSLHPQSLSFWRWPAAPHQGAALYLVLDRPDHLATPLLLYVGETGRADRRWKGDHDCKHYLAAYGEALAQVHLAARLSIRFWCDVPSDTRARRALEQALIRHWLPPFNKETRERWATPFTADLA